MRDNVISLHNICNNKVVPATITYEDDQQGTPAKKKTIATSNSSAVQSNANAAVMGGKDAKDAMNMRTLSATKSGAVANFRKNKVAPISVDDDLTNTSDVELNTDMNTVTCRVEVHRCKTKSPPVAPEDDVTGIINNAFTTTESCLTIDSEKDDETKV